MDLHLDAVVSDGLRSGKLPARENFTRITLRERRARREERGPKLKGVRIYENTGV